MAAVVQSAGNTGANTVTVTLGAATTAGNCLVACIGMGSGVGLASVSSVTLGGAGDNWAALKAAGDLTNGAEQLAVWADPNCAGGQTNVTVTVPGVAVTLAYVFEASGIAASSVLDQFGTADSGGTASGPAFSVSTGGATAQASELAVACAYGYNTTVTGPSSPWVNTATLTSTARTLQAGYNVLSSAGTVTYAGSFGAATFNGQVLVTLKAASGTAHPGTAPLSGSGTLGATATGTYAGTAGLSGSGSMTAARQETARGTASLSGSGSLTATGTAVPPISATFVSTAGDGTQTWSVTSPLNGPSASTLRILPPSSPSGSYPHSFLFALPVSNDLDTTYGDPISVIGDDLGAHNAYNTTVVVPSFPIQPWYADNPGNAQQSQESFMTALAAYMGASSFASGGEKNYLIGFSKSGIGGQGLIFRRPDVWAACASWDFPAMMTSYDGNDAFHGTVGGDPADCYGTDANFTANYELSSAHLSAWAAGGFTAYERLWIGGYQAFQADVNAYMPELTSAGILFNGAWNTLESSHAWHDDWVGSALAAIMVMPEAQGTAGLSGSGSLGGAALVTAPGAAGLSGSGTLTAAGHKAAPGAAGLSGSGSLTPAAAVTYRRTAGLSGAGSLGSAAAVTYAGTAGLSGSGSLTAAGHKAVPGTAGLSGSGSLGASEAGTYRGTAALSGSGSLTASGAVSGQFPGAAALSGTGSLAAQPAVTYGGGAGLSGSGSLAAAGFKRVPGASALSGTGSLTASGTASGSFSGTAALSGLGALAASPGVTVPGAAALAGSGLLGASASGALAGTAGLSGSGSMTAAVSGLVIDDALLGGTVALAFPLYAGSVAAAASYGGSIS
ncbi:MAG TPA: hypothetical protein VGH54_29415 [Mycobacterium sp.]|jgi:hypothetical protein|uniref:beta strand repeat-containing protein n=1 Tax=Mycobacterium sp. TaxID=1785 RepID=UPI002F40BBD7